MPESDHPPKLKSMYLREFLIVFQKSGCVEKLWSSCIHFRCKNNAPAGLNPIYQRYTKYTSFGVAGAHFKNTAFIFLLVYFFGHFFSCRRREKQMSFLRYFGIFFGFWYTFFWRDPRLVYFFGYIFSEQIFCYALRCLYRLKIHFKAFQHVHTSRERLKVPRIRMWYKGREAALVVCLPQILKCNIVWNP